MFNRIDIHAHVNFADFDADRDAVIDRTLKSDTAMINVGSDYDNSKSAVELAERYEDGVYAIVGMHPIPAGTVSSTSSVVAEGVLRSPTKPKDACQLSSSPNFRFVGESNTPSATTDESTPTPLREQSRDCSRLNVTGTSSAATVEAATSVDFAKRTKTLRRAEEGAADFNVEKFKELLLHPKVVGIGECGLDYFRMPPNSVAKQKEIFSAQIALANETKKPLMLHIRQAYDDALDILTTNAKVGGNAHFFAGTLEQARCFLDLGFTLSFTGVITFTRDYDELVRFTPLDMIQAETDSPFVAPIPHRGKRNEPIYVAEVIKKIAEIKKIPLDQVEKALMSNAKRVWGVL